MGIGFIVQASWIERIFWVCALSSTVIFFFRAVMMFAGYDADTAVTIDTDINDMSSDASFHILSINSIAAFFMMFGWIGLACFNQFSMGYIASLSIAVIAGFVSMVVAGYIFKAARKLASSGDTFTLAETVGLKASVYQKIPAGGKGKIQISVNGGMTREVDAVAEDQSEIESFQTVKVVKVVDSNTVSVVK